MLASLGPFHMPITEETFEAFLKCETKSHLYFKCVVGVHSNFSKWQKHLREKFKQTGWERLRSAVRGDQCYVGTPALQMLKDNRYCLIIDYTAALPVIHARLHALQLIRTARDTLCPYIPIRFVPSEKLTISDRLLLAFDALALSQTCGMTPRVGRIIHGCQYAPLTISLAGLIDKAQAVLGRITAQQAASTPPPLVLNKHCTECEFRSRCRQIAIEKDDLSLLSHIGEKERRKQNDKGIFTVLQLSHTFRPRRHSAAAGLLNHQPALQALAIRKNQIHILGTPTLSLSGTPVYIDVEGDPDRDFYYLIGLRISSGGTFVQYSYWANTSADERAIWADCLDTLSATDNPRLIHYGSYETQFLKRMRTRYPDIGNPSFLDWLFASTLNLLSVVYAHVYFPTYSNGLKEVASYLGFRWSDGAASGLTALAWRSQWESFRDPSLKEKLIAYNAEDCEAAEKVTEALSTICRALPSEKTPNLDVINVDSLQREYPRRFGEVEFVLPEFQRINEAAYWDYQRNKVYVKSNQQLKRLNRKTAKEYPLVKVPVNKVIPVEEQRPASCRHCDSTLIYKYGKLNQNVYDLKWSPAGMKRWVTRYSFPRYICWSCRATVQLYVHKHKYGTGLRSFLLYEMIELQVPQNAISKSVRQLFNLPLSRGSVNRLKATEADRYEGTHHSIIDRVTSGKLVHADETRVEIDVNAGNVTIGEEQVAVASFLLHQPFHFLDFIGYFRKSEGPIRL